MAKESICPTCGTKTSALQRAEMRPCNGCLRLNPVGFLYCGYCAAPMENTDIRAKLAEVAAPEGGWPNLSTQMLEVRFFLQQGQLDEAYELLSILQRRYPGHPELADLQRSGKGLAADADVEELVDSVLARSPALAGKAPRRRATRWDAPTVGSKEPTSVHDPVRSDIAEELDAEAATTVPKGRLPLELTDDSKPVRERTMVYRTVRPEPPRSGLTIAVDALQPAAPYATAKAQTGPAMPSDVEPTKPRRKDKKKKGKDSVKLKARKRALTSRKRKVESRAQRRSVSFGAGVLGRFGR